MKCKVSLILLALLFIAPKVFAQDVFSPYYVVIGGFKQEDNAKKFCDYAEEQNLPAVYAFNEERQTYYVYVRATQTKEVAVEILMSLQENSVFRDAWVFNGVLSGSTLVAGKQRPAEKQPPLLEPEPVIPDPVVEKPEETSSASVPQVEPKLPLEPAKPVGRPFIFKLVDGQSGGSLDGLVRLQESDKALQFRGFNGNEKVYVPPPSNKSGKWYVVCQVLGFRMVKKQVIYGKAHEVKGASLGPEEEVIIPLELERVKKGDYIEMDGVKFYNNTALFTPGSEQELDELVAMMQANPDYQIRLHGHTNGDQDRDIVSLGKSTNFFNPDVANAKTHGSARELALLRAELVKSYLVSKGIDAGRITTKGEGGTQMIFDSSGTLAGLNDRVEVEIRKH